MTPSERSRDLAPSKDTAAMLPSKIALELSQTPLDEAISASASRSRGRSVPGRVVRRIRRIVVTLARGETEVANEHDMEQLVHLRETGVLSVGRFTYGTPRVITFGSRDRIRLEIGSFCSIGPDVEILLGGNHRTDWISTYPFRLQFGLPGSLADGHPASRGPLLIGHDVWIGMGARILCGVHIGNGAVIGAGAVVTRDVPAYGLAVGNPARTVRKRFSEDTIAALESIAWWNWPVERIIEAVPLLCSDRVPDFVAKHERPNLRNSESANNLARNH